MGAREKLSVIIPTKDRHDDLLRLLESLRCQGSKPIQIIVVDGGCISARAICDKFSDLSIDYIQMSPPSLTVQRNMGIKALNPESTIAVFLDDDIVLMDGSFRAMEKFWDGSSQVVGGASFNLINESYKKPTLLEQVFLVNTSSNKILRSGFQGRISVVQHNIKAEWLVGCAMTFRKMIFDEFIFDEWFSGYARYEDVDFTYRVGRKYEMYVVAEAKVEHFNKPENLTLSFGLGKMEVINRLYFVKKNRDLSLALCYWALCGILLNNVIKGILCFDKRCMHRAKGNISGLIHSLSLFL